MGTSISIEGVKLPSPRTCWQTTFSQTAPRLQILTDT